MRHRTVPLLFLLICITMSGLLAASFASPAAAQSPTGTIAYIGGDSEIRLIEPDGSNPRVLWRTPTSDPVAPFSISSLDWKPDASEIAFASDHERLHSIFERDIYAIRSDGSQLRKLTNGPTRDKLGAYPSGSVSVRVRNDRGGGPYFVYVAGAPEPQTVSGPAGSSTTLVFPNVADFGPGRVQPVVGFWGLDRWFNAAAADVQAGQQVSAGTLVISGAGLRSFGAFLPSWRSDGNNVGFMQSCAAIKQVAANPLPAELGDIVAQPNVAGWTCYADWAPPAAPANDLVFSEQFMDGRIYRMTAGNTNPGNPLVMHAGGELLLELQWLPDGSGFVYAIATDFDVGAQTWQTANLYLYRFATGKSTALTRFSGELARSASFSPDGQWIVFERAQSLYGPADLWLMRHDGTQMKLLTRNGAWPEWSPRALPQPLPRAAFMPLVIR